MSKNIKEIGKELMGKSLNSFHRKTGLTQLEKNNEMQDGILNGILSQVDDAYIEKTEQNNVIHLDGSGDGVVVLDSIEGDTMVNLSYGAFERHGSCTATSTLTETSMTSTVTREGSFVGIKKALLKDNTTYTVICDLNTNLQAIKYSFKNSSSYTQGATPDDVSVYTNGYTRIKKTITTTTDCTHVVIGYHGTAGVDSYLNIKNMVVLEGDWTNRELPPYFEGLQSSFEEKVNDEGKYEIEILSRNKNLIDKEYFAQQLLTKSNITREIFNGKDCLKINSNLSHTKVYFGTNDNEYKTLRFSAYTNSIDGSSICHYGVYLAPSLSNWSNSYGAEKYNFVEIYNYVNERIVYIDLDSIQLEYGTSFTNYIQHKQNKIKLLLNEPLRGLSNGTKDELCIKDDKLVIKRKCGETTLNDMNIGYTNGTYLDIFNLGTIGDKYNVKTQSYMTCDKFPYVGNVWNGCQEIGIGGHNGINFRITYPKETMTVDSLTQWLQNNQTTVVYELAEPIYEEVLNEYGEPILLEGYENGTIYIDSTIIPTTTVRYTPKMESFKTLKEVENNNIMLTNDVNDNIIPYMMDVDLMIMEKEMTLMSHKNIRKMEVLDMTSMQKRTQDMLERLIKGKTLTEQECKTRVTTYLHAGKITDEQAEELMLLIDEVYA